MALIPEQVIDEIRSKADIAQIIGRHIQLRRAGRNLKGLCPFHNEKTPSFSVNAEKGFYYCFGCQAKGDVFAFLMTMEGTSFGEAAEKLAAELGIAIPETTEDGFQQKKRSNRRAMLEVVKIATQFYMQQLHSTQGATARTYLQKERGIGDIVANKFQLGFAPDSWDGLSKHLLDNHSGQVAAATMAGLIIQRKTSGFYDRFRNRLMCPIHTISGDVVGFSGRTLLSTTEANNDGAAKYINSSESTIYKKSDLLFGSHQAREAIRKTGRVILVEGNFDVLRLAEAGVEEVVAPLGTALTQQQVGLLKRVASHVVLLYDGDNAGKKAALASLQVCVANNLETRILALPDGEDPDTWIRNQVVDKTRDHATDTVRKLIDKAQPGFEFFVHEVWSHATQSAQGRAQAMQEARQVVKNVANRTTRDLMIGTMATAMGVQDSVVRRALLSRESGSGMTPRTSHHPTRGTKKYTKNQGTGNEAAQTPDIAPITPPQGQVQLIALLVDHPDLIKLAEELNLSALLTDPTVRDLYDALLAEKPIYSAFPENLHPSVTRQLLADSFADIEKPGQCLRDMLQVLADQNIQTQLHDLQKKALDAKRRGDTDLERSLVTEILSIRRRVDQHGNQT